MHIEVGVNGGRHVCSLFNTHYDNYPSLLVVTFTNLKGAGFFSLLSINIFSLSARKAFRA